MLDVARVVSSIPATNFHDAMKGLPPAGISSIEFMDREAVNLEGRRVAIRFKRFLFERHKQSHYGWVVESATVLGDEAPQSGEPM